MNTDIVHILLATYNGGRFIGPLLESIVNQTYGHWKLYIRDDGSQDNTLKIIEAFKKKYNHKRIEVLESFHVGVKKNFELLLSHALKDKKSEYFAFCDQDDIWLPQKLSLMLQNMKIEEAKINDGKPCLIQHDLMVVDQNLNIISHSMWNYQKINPIKHHQLNQLLVQNVFTGCGMLFNRALAEKVLPFSPEIVVHDWWVGMVAASLGHVKILSQPLVWYRSYAGNTIGTKNYGLWETGKRVLSFLNGDQNLKLVPRRVQAQYLLNHYYQELTEGQRRLLITFIQVAHERQPQFPTFFGKIRHQLHRRYLWCKNGFWYSYWPKNIAFLWKL